MMRRALAVAALLWCAGAGAAEPLAPLKFFVGEWMIEGDTTVDGKLTHWRAPYTITDEGGWLAGSATIFGARIHDYWGWDAGKKELLRIQLQSDGSHGEVRSSGWRGDVLSWQGEAFGSDGTRQAIRTSETRLGADSFRVEWAALDGKQQWKTYSKELLTRVKR